jgi:CheY-like chemotaxis protein
LAIDTLKENRNNTTILPDAILLDLNMPVMDGNFG